MIFDYEEQRGLLMEIINKTTIQGSIAEQVAILKNQIMNATISIKDEAHEKTRHDKTE